MSESSIRDSRDIRLQAAVYRTFNDDLMIALAGILAGIVILKLFIEFSQGMQIFFEYANFVIIAAFVAEYCLKLYVAESKSSFVREPIHIFDLIIIVLALLDISKISYFSILPDQAQFSPILRLVRVLPRAFLAIFLAGRTAERIKDQRIAPTSTISELQIATLGLSGGVNKGNLKENGHPLELGEAPFWIDIQNIKEENLGFIEDAARIPHDLLETKLLRASFQRIERAGDILSLFIWDSQMKSDILSSERLSVYTNNMLILFSEEKIVTLSRAKSYLFDNVSNIISKIMIDKTLKKNEFTDKILYFLLHQKLVDYSEIVRRIERKTIEFEEIPVDKTSPRFLEETFQFKKEILKISSNLWHFKKVLHQLTDKEYISTFKIDNSLDFDHLYVESEYLYETTQNIKESLISLIDLHTNTVSYDMNRVMKVIAVITCLAVIPSLIGGLLGVNLTEGNFPIRLSEIFFIVTAFMLLGIYAFYKMDWLK